MPNIKKIKPVIPESDSLMERLDSISTGHLESQIDPIEKHKGAGKGLRRQKN